MASIQTLKDFGEQMGLKGTELRDFIKEQQDLDSKERNRSREEQDKQREHDKIQQDKLDKFRLAQMEREKEKEQREREEQDKQREFEIERMKSERDKMYFELQMKATEVKKACIVKSEDEEREDNKEGSVASGHTRQRIGAKGPKMPCFDERSDDMDSFLHRFEVYPDSQTWSKGQ